MAKRFSRSTAKRISATLSTNVDKLNEGNKSWRCSRASKETKAVGSWASSALNLFFFFFNGFLDWWSLFGEGETSSSNQEKNPVLQSSWNRGLRRVVGGPVWIFLDYFETFCSSASRLWHFILPRLGLHAHQETARRKSWYFCDLWHHMLRSFGFTTGIIQSPFYFFDLGAGALFLF